MWPTVEEVEEDVEDDVNNCEENDESDYSDRKENKEKNITVEDIKPGLTFPDKASGETWAKVSQSRYTQQNII